MTARTSLQQAIGWVLDQAKQLKVTGCEVDASAGEGFTTSVRMGEVDTVEHHQDQSLEITVYCGTRKGCATTTDLRPEHLQQTLQAAYAIAQFTAADPCAGLPDPADLAKDCRDLDLYHPWPITIEAAIEQCLRCEAIALNADPRIVNSDGAGLTTYSRWHALGNSDGFMGAYQTSKHDFSVSVVAAENDQMQTDYGYTQARDFHDLWTVEQVAMEAANKTLQKLNPGKVKTGQYPILFSAQQSVGLIRELLSAIAGGRLYREHSFLVGALGQSIFPDFVHIHEDPFVSKGLASSPYDAEGVAVHANDLVQAGVLQSYHLDSYSARKLGMPTTGNSGGSHNIVVSHRDQTQQDLIRQIGTGLLVTGVIGQGVDLVTGNYSRGANGLWIENGEIQYPVEEITIAGNLKDMFKHIVSIANDVETRSSIHTGSILIDRMTIAS